VADFPAIAQTLHGDAPTLIEDVLNDPHLDENARTLYLQRFGAKSTMFAPMVVGGQWVGYVNAIYAQPRTFPDAEVRRLMALTGQAAIAVQAIQRLAETEARLQEIQTLQQFSRDLAGTLQVNEILNIFFGTCVKVTGFEYVQFSLVDQKQQRVKAVAGFNVSETQITQANHPLDSRDIMADIIRTGRTEIITGWDDRFDREVFEAEGHAQWVRIFTPVILRGENVGLVEAGYNKNVQVMPQEAQIRLLTALIDQIMLALDNAQRYEATQKTAQREQTIREITEKMRTATSLQDLVKTTARELGQRLSAEHAVVELGIETDTTTLRPGNSIQNRS
jgi:GAF domain-containing protein